MWIFTTDGMLSVVAHFSRKDRYLVRARQREHLTAFFREDCVEHTPDADYHWRVEADWATLRGLVAKLMDGVDYSNFKDAARLRLGDEAYDDLLHRTWSLSRRAWDGGPVTEPKELGVLMARGCVEGDEGSIAAARLLLAAVAEKSDHGTLALVIEALSGVAT